MRQKLCEHRAALTAIIAVFGIALTHCSDARYSVPTGISLSPAGLGGSNFAWYHLDPPCTREPYGVVYNYNRAGPVIDAELRQMYDNGQRRLRIPIFHGRGFNDGTIMDSTGGNLPPQFRLNLHNLLSATKAAGFVELEISFHPQGANDPTKWKAFSQDYYQENWGLIQNLHSIIAGAGVPYHIDLSNEGIPPPWNTALLQYSQELWNDYASNFGNSDTIGFSISANVYQVGQVGTVYGPSPFGYHGSPQLFDVHIYDETGTNFTIAFNGLKAQGYQGVPWIVGEAFYNDEAEATSLRQAAISSGQTIQYLTEWPLTPAQNCTDVDVAPPAAFKNYQAHNF